MVRHVVYPSAHQTKIAPELAAAAAAAEDQQQPDGYGDKLVKYIPAEVIAFFLPAYALAAKLDHFKEDLEWIGWLLVVGAAFGAVGYLLVKADKSKPPRWYFYPLSVLAFLGWAVGTSTAVAELFDLTQPDITGKLIVMAAVFVIPLIDELLTRYLPPSEA
jgi:membrane protein DedA with SNARE-associated domain